MEKAVEGARGVVGSAALGGETATDEIAHDESPPAAAAGRHGAVALHAVAPRAMLGFAGLREIVVAVAAAARLLVLPSEVGAGEAGDNHESLLVGSTVAGNTTVEIHRDLRGGQGREKAVKKMGEEAA